MTNTHVYILLDESGSMDGEQTRVVKGVNEYISELVATADNPESIFVTLMLFNSIERRVIWDHKQLKDVPEMKLGQYTPAGCTPLLDSMGDLMARIASNKHITKDDKVLFIIDTDGMENTSHEYTKDKVREIYLRHKNEDEWQFVFMGADFDAFAYLGGQLGMHNTASNTMKFSPKDRVSTYRNLSNATKNYSECDAKTVSNFFDNCTQDPAATAAHGRDDPDGSATQGS